MYTNAQKIGVGRIVLMFFKEVMFAHQGCIYLIKIQSKYKNKQSNIVNYYNLKKIYILLQYS